MAVEQNGRFKLSPAQIAQVAVWLVTIMLAYGALSTRIAVLETKYDALSAQLSNISAKIDRLLERQP